MTGLHRRGVLAVAALMAACAFLPGWALAQKRLVRLTFDSPVSESPAPMDMSIFGGSKSRTLREWIDVIDKAAKDPEINGAVLLVDGPGVALAQVEELSRAINRFKGAGKKVYCYLDHAANASFALASTADHISLTEYSTLDILGLHGEMMFYKGMFDKIGVTADMMHCGDYKSALEPYTRTEPSKENAEQINWLLDGIYDRWVRLIAEGRKLSPADVKAAVDEAPLEGKRAAELKLVDAIETFPAFRQRIQKEYGKDVVVVKNYGADDDKLKLDLNNPFALFQMFGDLMKKGEVSGKPAIAIVYIDGGITTGKSDQGPFSSGNAGSTTIRAAFEKAREDTNIKAVVVRVDSPGGSALGSDIMWDAATRCAREKPLIVSMGSVAGSGGYYVAIPGDVIFAEETTITGSIGVVGGKLVLRGLMDWAGLSVTEFNRGKNAGLTSTNRVWTDAERAKIRGYLDSVYDQFKGRVMASRGKRLKGDLEKMAGGRVYTGKQALELGLIDQIGGLRDAIKLAAEKSGLGNDYDVRVLPKPKDLGDIFAEIFESGERDDEWKIDVKLGDALLTDPLVRRIAPLLSELAPRQAVQMMRGLRNAIILDRERVGMFMPIDIDIR